MKNLIGALFLSFLFTFYAIIFTVLFVIGGFLYPTSKFSAYKSKVNKLIKNQEKRVKLIAATFNIYL